MNYDVPFVSNTPDDLHCFQAAYLMVIKYFEPGRQIDWEAWSMQTGFEENKGTWASAGLLWLTEQGYDVIHISLFDYKDFAEHGGDYLICEFGGDVADWQIKHSNIPLEQARARKLIKSGLTDQSVPTQGQIKEYLNNGYLIRCLVNSNKLNNKPGYIGHSVIVSGYDDNGFVIQDPGLPPIKDRLVPFSEFESAWADPNDKAKEFDAIKLVR